MTANTFRRIALGFSGAVEGAHMGHPDFRAAGRIFATLHTGDKTGMVKLTPEQQAEFIRSHPDMFEPEAGAWGRQGCTRVHLRQAAAEVVGEAMTLAWQGVSVAASKRTTRSRPATAKRTRTRAKSR
jgi:YjbR